jgi:V/A-type H+-transporting ATPase subunit B
VITQDEYENRSIAQSLEMGWNVLRLLPRGELYRVTEDELKAYYDAAPAPQRAAPGLSGTPS